MGGMIEKQEKRCYNKPKQILGKEITVMEEQKKAAETETVKEEPKKRGEDEKSTDDLEAFIEEQGIQLRY